VAARAIDRARGLSSWSGLSPTPRLARGPISQENPVKPLRTILHPTDFSERSEAALKVAYSLAQECDGRLVILHVFPDAVAAGMEVYIPIDEEATRAALMNLPVVRGGPPLARPIETQLSRGDASDEILRAAKDLGCDLIVMGTQGRSGLARALMGSVAESVLRRAECPVLAIRSPVAPAPRFATILHATDFSEEADAALREAVSLARVHGSRLIILHVPHPGEPPVWVYDRMAGSVPDRERILAHLRHHTAMLRAENPQVVFEHRLGEGGPAEEILRIAGAERCDLIVMGTRGRRGLERILAGSVAEEVMRKAPCPVLAVRMPLSVGEPAQHAGHPAPR
jgi:nucleotide-binding universal stress UspA family protein